MSQYANFYIRPFADKPYIPIADYSRSSAVYHICGDSLPYGEVKPLTQLDLTSFISSTRDEQQEWRNRINTYKEQITSIATFNNSVEEKQLAIFDIQQCINECTEELKEYEIAEDFFYFLKELIPFGIETPYLYAGIEANPNLSEED